VAQPPPYRGSTWRHSAALTRWIGRVRREQALEPDLPIIDPHHHLWDDDRGRYLLDEILADIGGGHNITQTVFIECRAQYRAAGEERLRPLGEVEFVNGVAAMSASGAYGPTRVAAAIVGHADLRLGSAVEDVLAAQVALTGGRFRGIRWSFPHDATEVGQHVTRFVEPGITRDATWRQGYAVLGRMGLTFEGWCYHPQIPELSALARAHPEVTIILDHVGGFIGVGPYATNRQEEFQRWKRSIVELASHANVVCKLGGLGMAVFGFDVHTRPMPPGSVELATLWRPFIETCIDAFGVERCMFESNFPVDKQSCDYTACWNAFKRITANASAAEKAALYHDTAARIYRLTA
jgi:predicted TIM-barrel fold metal-dependent hydrolase